MLDEGCSPHHLPKVLGHVSLRRQIKGPARWASPLIDVVGPE